MTSALLQQGMPTHQERLGGEDVGVNVVKLVLLVRVGPGRPVLLATSYRGHSGVDAK